MILSYKYRTEPNKVQAAAMNAMLADFCSLYNAALEQRIDAYRRRGVSIRYADQSSELKATRIAEPDLARWSFTAELRVLRRLEKTFAAFFARGHGFPRFRARGRFHAAEFCFGDGITLRKSGKVKFVGVAGEVKVRWHRELPSKPKAVILTRQAGKWYLVFQVEVDPAPVAANDNRSSIGVDLGLTNLLALSNGEMIARPNWTKRAAKGLRRRQRTLSRCKRGSAVRRKRKAALAKFQAHVAAKRRDFSHKVSRDLVNRFSRIAFEDLNIKGLARGMLAKHVLDAAWAQIVSFSDYKAANAGGEVKKTDPRGTSQECPRCGQTAKKTLAERMHRCNCGCVMPRDTASAIVVHQRAFGAGAAHGTLTQRIAA